MKRLKPVHLTDKQTRIDIERVKFCKLEDIEDVRFWNYKYFPDWWRLKYTGKAKSKSVMFLLPSSNSLCVRSLTKDLNQPDRYMHVETSRKHRMRDLPSQLHGN